MVRATTKRTTLYLLSIFYGLLLLSYLLSGPLETTTYGKIFPVLVAFTQLGIFVATMIYLFEKRASIKLKAFALMLFCLAPIIIIFVSTL